MSEHFEAFKVYAESLMNLDSVDRVVLFGSVARGDHGVNSDVDVLVEVSSLAERDMIENKAFEITSETGKSISPIIVQSNESHNLEETISKEGVEYVRS